MNMIEESFLRRWLKPTVECNLPGRLRLSFSKYRMLPKEALPYLHYIRDVMLLLRGVTDAEINPRIGTVLIRYDAAAVSSDAILRWIDAAVDEGIQIAKENVWQEVDEKTLAAIVRERLLLRLPH